MHAYFSDAGTFYAVDIGGFYLDQCIALSLGSSMRLDSEPRIHT